MPDAQSQTDFTVDSGKPEKKRILIICNYFLPGYKSGGSLRTVVNMIQRLGDKFDFRVITLNYDRDRIPYKTIKANEWNELNGVQVYYLTSYSKNFKKLRELILEANADSIYLNSVFSTLSIITLVLRRFRLIPSVNIILAPEGELSMGALQLKSIKKRAFMSIAKFTNLYKEIIWKTTSELEKNEVKKIRSLNGEVFIAPNMPPAMSSFGIYNQQKKPGKKVGEAKLVFLSRIMETKNIKWLLENLSGIKGKLSIDVYGPIEDESYWTETKKIISNLPENIKVEYKGSVIHEQVNATLFDYHFFILPTLGENFGHVFIEALSSGCPLIISDRTPWLKLRERKVGWDIALERPEQWVSVINECIAYSQTEYDDISSNARRFAESWLNDPKIEKETLNVLLYSLRNHGNVN